ncbi:MAG: hypothetical protein ACUVS5_12555 [Anaerolineae bacterium]
MPAAAQKAREAGLRSVVISAGFIAAPPAAAGKLYAADLAGGCLGALLSAVLFIPVLGISQTCAAVALAGVTGLLALL